MEWDVQDCPISGTYTKTYMARITGEDPVYVYHREFLRWRYEYDRESFHTRRYWALTDGVYEYRLRRFNSNHELVEDCREWFVVFEDEIYAIDYEDVLYTLFNLDSPKHTL